MDTGTLEYGIDSKGVWYRFEAPQTSYGNDLLIQLRSGLVNGSSFTFDIDMEQGFEIQEREDGKIMAIPAKINTVYEMGPVTMPAYPGTTAENRSQLLANAITAFLERKQEVNKIDYAAERRLKFNF